jgi:hypothetical protein
MQRAADKQLFSDVSVWEVLDPCDADVRFEASPHG